MAKKWKYKDVFVGVDGERKNGCTLEHRIVASQMLGRALKPEECVHHKDENPENNHPSNLMVFASLGDHARFHHTSVATLNSDGTFKSPVKLNLCLECGEPTKRQRKFCSAKCLDIGIRKVQCPPVEVLTDLIKRFTWAQIGDQFGVKSTAVRKWGRKYGLKISRKKIGQPPKPVKMATLTCVECHNNFLRPYQREKEAAKCRKLGPFCSNKCLGDWKGRMKFNAKKDLMGQ